MTEGDDIGNAVANNQVVDPRLLLPPDDDDRPDVHHEGDHWEGDVGNEVEGVLRLVDALCLRLIQRKLSSSKVNLKTKILIAWILSCHLIFIQREGRCLQGVWEVV